jgi:hypothetical protein
MEDNDVTPSREVELLQLVIRETMDTYTTSTERAAYRAGMSTSAMICDAVGARYAVKRQNKTQIMLRRNAQTCGDEIMRLRKLVEVNEPRVLSAAEAPQDEGCEE